MASVPASPNLSLRCAAALAVLVLPTATRAGEPLATRVLLLRSGFVSSTGKVAEAVRGVFTAMGAQVTVTPDGPDAAARTGAFEGQHVDGRARGLRCPDCGGVLLIHLSPDAASAARLSEIVKAARCTRPGEAPSTWPDAPAPGRR